MTDVVIAGAGFAGLSAALFLARRGVEVVVVERDEPPPAYTADDDFERWVRPGAPQCRQTHVLLGMAHRVLVDEAPDVLDALLQRGVGRSPVRFGETTLDGEYFLLSRRLVAEAALRRIVEREPGVTVIVGAVTGVVRTGTGDPPMVTGVHLASGESLSAGLVVDAGGRRTGLPSWLADAGCRPPVEQAQDCGFFYATRFFRVKPGREVPQTRVPASVALDYATVLAAGADNGTFSLTVTLSTKDPLRRRLTDPVFFSRVVACVPSIEPWSSVGDPITDISTMSRIENRRRSLVDDHGPIVGGVVSIGDAVLHTNPTLGRGISLAMRHSQHLADVVGSAATDPLRFVQDFHDWTVDNLVWWFDSQVAADGGNLARLEAGLRGERLAAPTDAASVFAAAAFACGQRDDVVARAAARVVHMFDTPAIAFGDRGVTDRIQRHMATHAAGDRAVDVPSRKEFEALAAG
jgi:2-polyprenyl-6-methoxyphenol hydroxylase-like FAD-dependent oxidoreductase